MGINGPNRFSLPGNNNNQFLCTDSSQLFDCCSDIKNMLQRMGADHGVELTVAKG